MRVAIVSTSDGMPGGFAAAYRLHKGLRQQAVDSLMVVGKKSRDDVNVVADERYIAKIWRAAAAKLDRIPNGLALSPGKKLSSAWVPNNTFSRVQAVKPDVVNLHWINNGFLRLESLKKFKQPLVWTFHDMWAFAGGEHYVGDCKRYQSGYTQDSRPTHERGWDVNRWIWQRKRNAWASLNNLTIITPSHWLAECVKQSVLFSNTNVEVIANGIDHHRFKPIGRDIAREILGLPKDKRLILFGAVNATSDARKGFHLLKLALQEVRGKLPDTELVIFGASGGMGEADFGRKCHYLGRLHDEISLALVYAAADVFAAPSVQDNLPNTVLESLACGTPVIAFNIGGMPDMIEHQRNGYLAKAFEPQDFAAGLQWVLADDTKRWPQLSQRARQKIEQEFTLGVQANNYLRLFKQIINA